MSCGLVICKAQSSLACGPASAAGPVATGTRLRRRRLAEESERLHQQNDQLAIVVDAGEQQQRASASAGSEVQSSC